LWGVWVGPGPVGWVGVGGGAAVRTVGPPHPTLSPRPAGGEGYVGGIAIHLPVDFQIPVVTSIR
jgi:hypothetical protein